MTAEEFDIECNKIADCFIAGTRLVQDRLAKSLEALERESRAVPPHLVKASLDALMIRLNEVNKG
jgi:hypothetical protein